MFSMNRWILRRQRKLLCAGLFALVFMSFYIIVIHEDIRIEEKHFQPFSERCLSGTAKQFLKDLVSRVDIVHYHHHHYYYYYYYYFC